MNARKPRSAARVLVDLLVAQGVERASCVPGESYLAVLDALHDSGIDLITCRNEGGAAMMAEAYGKLTGRPGICFVTRGPGATNASPGLHIARQDSTPLILFVGQVERGFREREAFQELDYRAAFGGIAKWVVEIDDPKRLPELLARAFRVAMQGRPGPVVVALPEDMLDERVEVADAPFVTAARAAPSPDDLAAALDMLDRAERPVCIVGGSRWSEQASSDLHRFAEMFSIPVATAFRRADLISAEHPHYLGELGIGPNPVLAAAVRDADLILLLGERFSEIASSSYALIDVPVPAQRLIHVHPDQEELGRVYQPNLAIPSAPGEFLAAALMGTLQRREPRSFIAAVRESYLAWSGTPRALPGRFQYGEVITWLRQRLPADAILTNGAGNFAGWVQRYYRFRRYGTQLAPTSGTMGYGVPAAVMAKRQCPAQIVLCVAGDGDFLMNGQEFATAVHHHIPIIVMVIDNGMYGTIRMHQERHYPERVIATTLTNPDFALLARAYGGYGETIETTAEFAPAFERALASGLPSILHCKLDAEALTPAANLADIRAQALRTHAAAN